MKVSRICIEVFFSLIWVMRVPYMRKTIVFVQFYKIAPRKTKLLKNCQNKNKLRFMMCLPKKNTALTGLAGALAIFFLQKVNFLTDSAMSRKPLFP